MWYLLREARCFYWQWGSKCVILNMVVSKRSEGVSGGVSWGNSDYAFFSRGYLMAGPTGSGGTLREVMTYTIKWYSMSTVVVFEKCDPSLVSPFYALCRICGMWQPTKRGGEDGIRESILEVCKGVPEFIVASKNIWVAEIDLQLSSRNSEWVTAA